MDNKLEFIKNLKELFKEYNIFNCFNTPEFMADELSENLQIIIDDYKKKEAIASDDIQEIVKETIELMIKDQVEYNKFIFDSQSYAIKRIINGSTLLEGETTPDRRITRLKNAYEIYRDNITKEQLIVIRYADNIVIAIRIKPDSTKEIYYYKEQNKYTNNKYKEWEFFKIDLFKILENESTILNNDLFIKELVKEPILDEGVIACNGRIIRYNDQKAEIYFDRKTKENITVTRMGNQVIIEYKDKGIKKLDRLFINGSELTIEDYMDLVIQNDIPNIFPEHYKNIMEEDICSPETLEWITEEPILEIGCQTYEGRIYRAISQEEKYIDLISGVILSVKRNKNEQTNITIKNKGEIINHISLDKKEKYQKVK